MADMSDIEARREHERRKAKEEGVVGLANWWARTNSFELISSTGASPRQLAFGVAALVAFAIMGGLFHD